MDEEENNLLSAAESYLNSIGAKPVVIGGIGISKVVDMRKYTYELRINFTGIPPERAALAAIGEEG